MNYFKFAYRNLKKKGIRSYLTLLGICIGILAIVSLITLGNGLKAAVSSQFGVSSTELISVQASGGNFGPPGTDTVNPLTFSDVEEIKKLSSVREAVGRMIVSGKLEFNNKVVFGYAMNIPEGDDRDFVYNQIEAKAISGRLLEDGDSGKVFLGYNFYADKVGIGKPILPGNTVKIQDKSFEVVGILEKKGSFIMDNLVFMNEKELQSLFNNGDELNLIAVLPTDKENMDKTKEDVERLLRGIRGVKVGSEDFTVSTPEASLAQINSILNAIQIFVILVASISIFIGAIGIINTMTTSVLERKKEIGIMKAIGATNNQIFMQFFVESGILGLIGGGIGIFLGIIIGYFGVVGINNFIGGDMLPKINFFLIFFSLLGSFLIGALAGILPAMKAAKQNPVDALRG
ncbi:MAG TPA: ABC transporter permease [Candidatus Pacearchaeota archaeon]|nr:ABC transporter permease [Candidatus Pacearchaeota archaeon]